MGDKCLAREYLGMVKMGAFGLLLLIFNAFHPSSVFAEETGFFFAAECKTSGTLCEYMKEQDTIYNSWNSEFSEDIFVSFTDQTLPEHAIIDSIQIKMRIRTSTSGWSWFAYASTDGGNSFFPPVNCTTFGDICRYTTTKQFNAVTSPTMTWVNNNPQHIVTAEELVSDSFRLKIWQNGGFKHTDIDYLSFNIVYHIQKPAYVGPAPFLDLPWDYEGAGLTFSDAANAINSYFDHEYPLLSFSWAVPEGSPAAESTVPFNKLTEKFYSSHDGYDYGTLAQATYDNPVLAAAGGTATYVTSCSACGNAIHIDHGNGYQTRYYHLQSDGLITSTAGHPVEVTARQQIGKIGFTGNVRPQGEPGAHIHFMVIQDKNNDGDFEDNIPDGLTDPYGWQSDDPDPWELFTFEHNGMLHQGNKSYYLWQKKIDGLKANLPANGGVFTLGKVSAEFPADTSRGNGKLEMLSSPIAKISDTIRSLGSTININIKNALGESITFFNKPIFITMHYSDRDLENIKPESLSIYSTTDFVHWEKEESIVDLFTKGVSADVSHLTYFAVAGERKDILPPVTIPVITGQSGESGWYRSDVELVLDAQDNENGLGVGYTAYKPGTGDWKEYTGPLSFTDEGTYTIDFYSVDNDDNIETEQTIQFSIDKTAPEAAFQFEPVTREIKILGLDNNLLTSSNKTDISKQEETVTISDKAGNSLSILIKERKHGKEERLRIESLHYNAEPLITIPKNFFSVRSTTNKRTENFELLEQEWNVTDEIKLKLEYKADEDTTYVIFKDGKNPKQQVPLPGMKLLQVGTERGNLNYSY